MSKFLFMSKSQSSSIHWLSKPIQALLLDITGVLYEGGTRCAINGSIEAIQKLRAAGISFRLVTNESQTTTCQLLEKLTRLGYDFKEHELITPAMICRKYLQSHQLRPRLLIHQNLKAEFENIDFINPNCVVIGDADEDFTFKAMNECFQLLMNLKLSNNDIDNGKLLISLGRNKYYKENDKLKLDLGAYTAALEYATDLKAKIIGKPDGDYFQAAIDTFESEFSKENIAMIGDDIMGDVKGAQDFGIRGILVRTGKYLAINENHPLVKPDKIVDNLQCAVDEILCFK